MKDYTPEQALILEMGLQLAQLSDDPLLHALMSNSLRLARYQAYVRAQKEVDRTLKEWMRAA